MIGNWCSNCNEYTIFHIEPFVDGYCSQCGKWLNKDGFRKLLSKGNSNE